LFAVPIVKQQLLGIFLSFVIFYKEAASCNAKSMGTGWIVSPQRGRGLNKLCLYTGSAVIPILSSPDVTM